MKLGTAASTDPTLLDIVTLAIAILGFGLAVASLVWQVASWKLSGPRVRTQIGFGFMTANGAEVLTIAAINRGRSDVEITSWAIMLPDQKTVWPVANPGTWDGPPVPLTLTAGHGVTWYALIPPIAEAMQRAGFGPQSKIRATVMLGTGDRVVSKKGVNT